MPNHNPTLQTLAQLSVPPGTELDAQGIVEVVGVDLCALLAFYEAIGFRAERKTGSFAVVSGFGMRIFLAENPDARVGKRWTNVRIVVPNVDLVWHCINSLGLSIVAPIGDRPYGIRDFVVADPCGFEVRFAQVLG